MNNKKLVIAAAITGMVAAGSLGITSTAHAAEKANAMESTPVKAKGIAVEKVMAVLEKTNALGKDGNSLAKKNARPLS